MHEDILVLVQRLHEIELELKQNKDSRQDHERLIKLYGHTQRLLQAVDGIPTIDASSRALKREITQRSNIALDTIESMIPKRRPNTVPTQREQQHQINNHPLPPPKHNHPNKPNLRASQIAKQQEEYYTNNNINHNNNNNSQQHNNNSHHNNNNSHHQQDEDSDNNSDQGDEWVLLDEDETDISKIPLEQMSYHDVSMWFQQIGLKNETIRKFNKKKVNGKQLWVLVENFNYVLNFQRNLNISVGEMGKLLWEVKKKSHAFENGQASASNLVSYRVKSV